MPPNLFLAKTPTEIHVCVVPGGTLMRLLETRGNQAEPRQSQVPQAKGGPMGTQHTYNWQ